MLIVVLQLSRLLDEDFEIQMYIYEIQIYIYYQQWLNQAETETIQHPLRSVIAISFIF